MTNIRTVNIFLDFHGNPIIIVRFTNLTWTTLSLLVADSLESVLPIHHDVIHTRYLYLFPCTMKYSSITVEKERSRRDM